MSDSAVGEETNNNTHHSYNSVSDPGLLDRTAYTNASVALQHIEKVDEMSPPHQLADRDITQVAPLPPTAEPVGRRAGTTYRHVRPFIHFPHSQDFINI